MAAFVKLPQGPPLQVALAVGASLFCPLPSFLAVDSFGKPAFTSNADRWQNRPRLAVHSVLTGLEEVP